MEGLESCDGTDLGGATCEGLGQGFRSGELRCTADCRYDISGCRSSARMGEPCTANKDCESGVCLMELWMGFPGGICTSLCSPEKDCGVPGMACAPNIEEDAYFCLPGCTNNDDCRQGYSCVERTENTSYCWPTCRSADDCAITRDCVTEPEEDNFGFCNTPFEDCSNGVDDDFDGAADCADPYCRHHCPWNETCDNGIDDDGDGLADCEDAECAKKVVCTGIVCHPSDSNLQCGSNLTGERNDQSGSTDEIEDWCGTWWNQWPGPEYIYRFTVESNQIVSVEVEGLEETATFNLFLLRTNSSPEQCNPSECYAYDVWYLFAPGVDFEANPGYMYYIAVEGWMGYSGAYDIAVSCEPGEDCGNGMDDDDDGLIDCEDPSCFGQEGCTTEGLCTDGSDNDADGDTDCADSDCATEPYCSPNKQVLVEAGFDDWTPPGWTLIDYQEDSLTWRRCGAACDRSPDSLEPPFALCDATDVVPGTVLSEVLVTPSLDLSTATHLWLHYEHAFENIGVEDSNDFGIVEYSTNGGMNWEELIRYGTTTSGTEFFDLSAVLTGNADVLIRFRYENGGMAGGYWALDNVRIEAL